MPQHIGGEKFRRLWFTLTFFVRAVLLGDICCLQPNCVVTTVPSRTSETPWKPVVY